MNQQETKQKEKYLNRWAWVLSAVVLILITLMGRYKIHVNYDFSFLPPFHASVNFLTFLVLLFALYKIKNNDIKGHQKAIYVALGLSLIFLLSYVTYHLTTEETKYCGEGMMRKIYFFILISHIVLAAVVFPLVLLTFTRAFTEQYERHKRMARWVFPLWLYVAISGPICYLLLRPCY